MLVRMRLVSVGGWMVAGVLGCAGGGSSTTAGSSSGVGSTGDVSGSETTDPTTQSTVQSTTSMTTAASEPTTTGEPGSTGEPGTGDTGGTTDPTTVGSSSSGGTTGGDPNASRCEGAVWAICEDFEEAEDGGFPAGWGARGDEWGEGVIGVASDDAERGFKALKVDGGDNGQHFMDYKGDLGGLGSHHYGRVFMKVAIPAPWPADGVLHADFIENLGPGPKGGTHNVRWGVVENIEKKMQWIYNVQPSNGDPEFAEGTQYVYEWSGEWQCMEWFYDEPSQQGGLWIDGVEIPIQPGANHVAEIPVFESLGVGLGSYQPAGEGFTVWFDELAYDPERIGCDG